MRLFKTVTTCRWQFARNDTFGEESKLHDAITEAVCRWPLVERDIMSELL
jgi:hypothetical protein